MIKSKLVWLFVELRNTLRPLAVIAAEFQTTSGLHRMQGWFNGILNQDSRNLSVIITSTVQRSRNAWDKKLLLIRNTHTSQCFGKPLFFLVPVLTKFWSDFCAFSFFFVKTQRIRNKPSNFTNFFKLSIIYKQSKSAKNVILSMFKQNLFNLPC